MGVYEDTSIKGVSIGYRLLYMSVSMVSTLLVMVIMSTLDVLLSLLLGLLLSMVSSTLPVTVTSILSEPTVYISVRLLGVGYILRCLAITDNTSHCYML